MANNSRARPCPTPLGFSEPDVRGYDWSAGNRDSPRRPPPPGWPDRRSAERQSRSPSNAGRCGHGHSCACSPAARANAEPAGITEKSTAEAYPGFACTSGWLGPGPATVPLGGRRGRSVEPIWAVLPTRVMTHTSVGRSPPCLPAAVPYSSSPRSALPWSLPRGQRLFRPVQRTDARWPRGPSMCRPRRRPRSPTT